MKRRSVVLEGPDGGGKSTLAEFISRETGMRVQQGSGPPRAVGEIERRTREYLAMSMSERLIFDRHPAISQVIYSQIRQESMSAEYWDLVDAFYATDPFIIYCRSTDNTRHVVKEGEDPTHIARLNERYGTLVSLYDDWALSRADHIFRVGSTDPTVIVRMINVE